MEVHIDTEQIVQAALVSALGNTNAEELAKAMTKTLLEGPPRYGYSSNKNLLQELMHSAVSEVARKVIDEILLGHEADIAAEVRRQLGSDVVRYAADVIVKRIKDSKIQ